MWNRRQALTAGVALAASACSRTPTAIQAADDTDQLFFDNLEGEGDVNVRAFQDWTPLWHRLPAAERELPQVAADNESVDYAQFPAGFESSDPVDVNGAAMRKALAWSSIDVARLGPRVLFGLRGAELLNAADSADGAKQQIIRLRDARPDHLNRKCIIGVWDTQDDSFWATQASTAPHVVYLYAQRKAAVSAKTSGAPIDTFCNMLSTGVYNYYVGTHHNNKTSRQPGAFRLNDSVAVLRNLDEGPIKLTRFDTWDFQSASIADNIHAGAESDIVSFWSAGCQVVPGRYSEDRRTPGGEWRNFRVAAGLKPVPAISSPNTAQPNCWETDEDGVHLCPPGESTGVGRYSYVLLTGTEARLAAQHPELADTDLRFARLRRGSSGPRVTALTTVLGTVQPTSRFNALVQRRVIEKQLTSDNGADGIITPAEATRLGLNMTW